MNAEERNLQIIQSDLSFSIRFISIVIHPNIAKKNDKIITCRMNPIIELYDWRYIAMNIACEENHRQTFPFRVYYTNPQDKNLVFSENVIKTP
jgi:hypothetical protein